MATTRERSKLFYRQLTAELNAIPGVRSVGLAAVRILENNESDSWMTIEGYHPKATETPDAYMNWIGPGYFATLGRSDTGRAGLHGERHREAAARGQAGRYGAPRGDCQRKVRQALFRFRWKRDRPPRRVTVSIPGRKRTWRSSVWSKTSSTPTCAMKCLSKCSSRILRATS